ncbi:hypothetical protein IAU59_006577 [Kwoniella sp. CBS 9459]
MIVKREHAPTPPLTPTLTSTVDDAIAEAMGMDDTKPNHNEDSAESSSPSPKKKQKASPKKKAGPTSSPSTSPSSKDNDDKPRYAKNAWTAEEDTVFIELMLKTLHKNLFAEVKADQRLAREGPAVRAHLIAMMNRLKKGQN